MGPAATTPRPGGGARPPSWTILPSMEPDTRRAPHLATRGLSKVYGQGGAAIHALREVDLDIAGGELAILLGPSGSGKSTLLNILGGLDCPSSGQVLFGEQELTAFDDRHLTAYRREHVGFVFQFYNLIPSLTARENVDLVTEIAVEPMPADQALALVGLQQRMDHFPAQLSGGEQQRVAIARAIAKQPAVLLCDEPTGALDSQTGILVLDAIARVNRDLGTTTLLITHNAGIAGMADRVIHMADGRIASQQRNARRLAPAQLHW